MPGSRERFLSVLRDTPPLEYLEVISPTRPTSSMRESIQRMQRTGITDEVINVVSDYVMRKNGFRYSAPYAEKIADTLLKKGAFTAEEALEFFASIAKARKKEEANKKREEEKVTVEEVADLVAEMAISYSIPLAPTAKETEELEQFSEKMQRDRLRPEQIKAFLTDFDRRAKETKRKRIDEMRKAYAEEYVKRCGGNGILI